MSDRASISVSLRVETVDDIRTVEFVRAPDETTDGMMGRVGAVAELYAGEQPGKSDAEQIAAWLEEHFEDDDFKAMTEIPTDDGIIRVPQPDALRLAAAIREGIWRR